MRQLVRPNTGAIAALSLVFLLVSAPDTFAQAEEDTPRPASRKAKVPDPKPGDRLEVYQARYKGLHETGGIAVKGLAAGYSFRIWEGLKGKEATISETFLPCDPSDTGGLVYLPKLTLTVMDTPEHVRYVVGESKQDQFFGPEPIDKFIAANEALAVTRVVPAPNLWALLQRWYARNIKREKHYQQVVSDGQFKAYLAELDGGKVESVLFVPDFEHAMPEEIAVNATPGGLLRRVDYLADYRKIVLDDLYGYVFKELNAKKKKKHH